MKRVRHTIVIAALTTLVLTSTGCAPGSITREEAGSVAGAAAGGILGNQLGDGQGQAILTAAGAVIGALAGAAIGAHLDEAAIEAQSRATRHALDTAPVGGPPVIWSAPQSSSTPATGAIRIVREGRHRNTGDRCREYRQTVKIGEREEELIGTACITATGAWKAL